MNQFLKEEKDVMQQNKIKGIYGVKKGVIM